MNINKLEDEKNELLQYKEDSNKYNKFYKKYIETFSKLYKDIYRTGKIITVCGNKGVGKTVLIEKLTGRSHSQRQCTDSPTVYPYKENIYLIDTVGINDTKYEHIYDIIKNGHIGIYVIDFDVAPEYLKYIAEYIKDTFKNYTKVLICLNKLSCIDIDYKCIRNSIEIWKKCFAKYNIHTSSDFNKSEKYTLVAIEIHGSPRVTKEPDLDIIKNARENGALDIQDFHMLLNKIIN